jgi:hypothetical protein
MGMEASEDIPGICFHESTAGGGSFSYRIILVLQSKGKEHYTVSSDDTEDEELRYFHESDEPDFKSEEELKYIGRIQEAIDRVKGKEIASSEGGEKGYLLKTSDGFFVICYLGEDRLEMLSGAGEPSADEMSRIGAISGGAVSSDSDLDMESEKHHDISSGLKRSHRRLIDGAAIGDRSFNICFPEGVELENMILEDEEGRLSLKVFWEQW